MTRRVRAELFPNGMSCICASGRTNELALACLDYLSSTLPQGGATRSISGWVVSVELHAHAWVAGLGFRHIVWTFVSKSLPWAK